MIKAWKAVLVQTQVRAELFPLADIQLVWVGNLKTIRQYDNVHSITLAFASVKWLLATSQRNRKREISAVASFRCPQLMPIVKLIDHIHIMPFVKGPPRQLIGALIAPDGRLPIVDGKLELIVASATGDLKLYPRPLPGCCFCHSTLSTPSWR